MDVGLIKQLRDQTSLGISDCRKALMDNDGDYDKALKTLRQRGIEVMEKRKLRKTSNGTIESYIHFGGNLGSLVEVNCETDFVAKTELFKKFAKDLAMHVAATNPLYLTQEEVPEEAKKSAEDEELYIKETCLMRQAFVKDTSKTISDYLQDVISQTGEKVVIRRFSRFSLGEDEN